MQGVRGDRVGGERIDKRPKTAAVATTPRDGVEVFRFTPSRAEISAWI
jgi:hypothetical protein